MLYEDLKSKVVVITGAAGALGQSVVRYFHQGQAQLALIDIAADYFKQAFHDALNEKWLLLDGDITQPDVANNLIQQVVDRFGQVDVLVNIAGGYRINVNAVLPSTLDTPANRNAMPNADFEKWVAPASMANVIGFLASEVSRDISGASIPVYGGSL